MAAPEIGALESVQFTARGPDGTELNGRDQRVSYSIATWPEEDFSVSIRVYLKELPKDRLAQIFSAWAGPSDDPLRIVLDHGKLHARIEAGTAFSTPGAEVQSERWYSVAAVKRATTLTLYLDGKAAGSTNVPVGSNTQTTACALGGNPRFTGNEFIAARFADFTFYARALSEQEISESIRMK
jgi:hypothetical protein